MRRAILLAVMTVLILAVGASVAYAALIQGTPRDDKLTGTEIRDTIFGFKGDDVLRGLGGTDTLQGGGGDDIIFGGPGQDVLRGRGGNDQLHGGTPTDPKHTDEFFCGAGFDTIYLEESEHSPQNRTVKACEKIVNEK